MTYLYQTKVELYDTDSAGIIFYSNLFQMAHRALSSFLFSKGLSIQERFEKKDYFFPVVHAEADYLKPLKSEDEVEIQLTVDHLGETSFSFNYLFLKRKLEVAKAKTVHVVINEHCQKMPIPDEIEKALKSI